MFAFLKRLFGASTKPAASAAKTNVAAASVRTTATKKPRNQVPYRAELTASLKSDHQQLLAVYTNLLEAAKGGQFATVSTKIAEFETMLKDHLAEEFKDLYIYVERFSKDTTDEDRESIRDFKNEMQSIGGVVMGVINKYRDRQIDENEINGVIEEFSALGPVLVDRIEREESQLYPMYDRYGQSFA